MSRKIERRGKSFLVDMISSIAGVESISPERLLAGGLRKILVVRQHDQMGDMLLTVPALRGIKRRFPDAEIDIVASSVNSEVLQNNPYIRKVFELGRRGRGKGRYSFFSLIRELRKEHYDLAIVLNTVSFSVTSMLIAVMSGARYRVGCTGAPFGYGQTARIYHIELPVPDEKELEGMNESEHNLYPLAVLGIREEDLTSVLIPSKEDEGAAEQFVRTVFSDGETFAVIHPGAGKVPNRWPAERFAEVSKRLDEELGVKTVAVAGPMDSEPFKIFLESVGNCPPVIHSPSIGFLAALMKKASLVLCNDTGVMHIAGAVGARTVVVFGPTDPGRWKPANGCIVALRAEDRRVESVSVEEVFAAASNILGRLHGDEGNRER